MTAVGVLATVAAGCGGDDGAAAAHGKSPIKLGLVASLTGPAAPFGQQQLWGAQQAADDWNAKHERRIVLSVQDDQSDPKSGVSAMRKVIDGHPDAIVGPTASTIGVALAPIATASKIPLMSASVSAPEFVSPGGFTFRDHLSTPQLTGATTEWAMAHGVHSVGMLMLNAADGKAAANEITHVVANARGTLTGTEYVENGQSDFQSQLTKLVAKQPDALWLFLIAPESIAQAMKQARDLGFKGRFLTLSNVENDAFLKAAGGAGEGAVWSTETAPDGPQADAYKAFAAAFGKRHGQDPDIIAANSYDATMLLARGVAAGGGGAALRDWLHQQKSYPGITGPISFDASGDIVKKPLTIRTVRSGKFVAAGSS